MNYILQVIGLPCDNVSLRSILLRLLQTKREKRASILMKKYIRSFVDRKLKSLSTYTSLPLINQMEVVLMDLPNEISNLFLIHEKLICSKSEILEFCDSIQELAQTLVKPVDEQPLIDNEFSLNEMEIFNYDPEWLSDDIESVTSDSSSVISPGRGATQRRGATRGRGTVRGRGRVKIRSSNPPNRESRSDSTDLDSTYTDDSSQNCVPMSENVESDEMTVCVSPSPSSAVRAKRSKKNEGKVIKRGRGRPRKNLITIPEDSEDTVRDYINHEVSDVSHSSVK